MQQVFKMQQAMWYASIVTLCFIAAVTASPYCTDDAKDVLAESKKLFGKMNELVKKLGEHKTS